MLILDTKKIDKYLYHYIVGSGWGKKYELLENYVNPR